MVRVMSFNVRAAMPLLLVGLSLACLSSGCTASTGAPACNALAACCNNPNIDDQSSCTETAQSVSDAACGMQLEQYQQNGTCPADGGAVPAGDASH
jgi:hypothetical protein